MVVHGAQLENSALFKEESEEAGNSTRTSAKRWKVKSRLKRPRPRFCKEALKLTTLYLCTQVKGNIF